jgi:hypothetical protein
MISGKLLRPVVVMALAAFELSSPTDAEARDSALACNQEYFIHCENMTDPQIENYCNAACQTWETAQCDTSTGGLVCSTDPF